MNGKKETGIFGIDIHRASATGTTKYVDKYSAGCQVFENADDFNEFIKLCERHANYYGNRFSYTLIDFRAVKRETRKRWLIGAGAALLALGLVVIEREKLKSMAEELSEFFTNQLNTTNENAK
jgi:hypothetical protein